MASKQQERPITYSDVLDVKGPVGQQPITKEDAALMQSLESMAFGRTPKGGPASAMQSTADRNIIAGAVPSDAHTFVAEEGMRIKQGPMPSAVTQKECVEYVAGHPVAAALVDSSVEEPGVDVPKHTEHMPIDSIRGSDSAAATPVTLDVSSTAPTADISTIDKIPDVSVSLVDPTVVSVDTAPKPVTIGQALEAASVWAGNSKLDRADVRAIESAESRATGHNIEKKGVAAAAQSALTTSARIGTRPPTLSDVLKDTSKELSADKIVKDEDAAKVTEAEKRGRPFRNVKMGGVAECMQAAAEMNKDM